MKLDLPTLSRRLVAAATPPRMTSVAGFLTARIAGDAEAETYFLGRLRLASDVFKQTNLRRFDDTMPAVLAAVPPTPSLRVLDVACSSGISTVELHAALAARGGAVEVIGTDILTEIFHVRLPDGTAILVEPSGHVLAVEIDGMVIDRTPLRPVRLHHPWRVLRAQRVLRRERGRWSAATLVGPQVARLPLVSFVVDRTPGVRVVQEDILAPAVPGTFQLIRAANILNRSYFAPAELERLAAALAQRLADGGVLFVVRTDGRTGNAGTLWRRQGTAFTVVDRVGGGSESEAPVEAGVRAALAADSSAPTAGRIA